jgi:hypothetical protein
MYKSVVPYLTENKLRLHYKDQRASAVYGEIHTQHMNKNCVLYYACSTV